MRRRVLGLALHLLVLLFVVPGVAPAEREALLIGPSGGAGGVSFRDPLPPRGSQALQIAIRYGAHIVGINMGHKLPDGRIWYPDWKGGTSGSSDVFNFEAGEYLAGMWGCSDEFLDGVRFRTNRRRLSPAYGTTGNCRGYFRYDVPDGYEIVGFRGRSGALIDALGIIIRRR